MKLYNSLTREKSEFIPNEAGKVKLYTCGPTVYHYAHIGNLRTYIMEDILEKYLRYTGYEVDRVMNITDVGHLTSDADTGDDKMLAGAKRERKSVMEIAQYYTDAFFADCEKLNIRKPDTVIPATSCIDGFIDAVQKLVNNGSAYIAGGNIYFDTSTLKEYYVFNKQDEDDLLLGARDGVEADDNKRNKTDFVLWFTKSKFDDQELKWDSPWGVGYPGWHIECSVISLKHLGEYLDIHCGGIDNAFPHHTNEIAQSEALLGHKWCNYWFHALHLNTSGEKMSKSSGEFLTVSLLESKGYDALAYRYFCLQSHYRKNLAFSYDALDNAATAYGKLIARVATLDASTAAEDDAELAPLRDAFRAAMDNDLNTSLAITVLYDVLKADITDAGKLWLIAKFDEVLSLDLLARADALRNTSAETSDNGDDVAEIERLVAERGEARAAKNWARSDEIRDELKAMDIVVEDTAQGAKWKRV